MNGYEIDEQAYYDLINDRIASFGKQEADEDYQILDARYAYDEEGFALTENIIAIDNKIIKKANVFCEIETDDSADSWIWNLDKISNGTYPLDKIPGHVRELAKKLYYK